METEAGKELTLEMHVPRTSSLSPTPVLVLVTVILIAVVAVASHAGSRRPQTDRGWLGSSPNPSVLVKGEDVK